MSEDTISRQAAIDEIKEIYEWHDNVTKERIIEHFKQLPSAERLGRWLPLEGDGYADGAIVYDVWECSNCGNEERGEDVPETNRYCRWCGAQMEVE